MGCHPRGSQAGVRPSSPRQGSLSPGLVGLGRPNENVEYQHFSERPPFSAHLQNLKGADRPANPLSA
eukprot:15474218-Alexandrium_andersonii.AAC.1